MAEIRLVCPGCAAEYRLSDAAIPPQGREVECSGCGHVWHATPLTTRLALVDAMMPPAQTAPGQTPPEQIPPSQTPPLNRSLPPSVLDILRDEVEHERRARAAETAISASAEAQGSAPDTARSPADPDWPATTITRHIDPRPSPHGGDTPAPAEPAPDVPAAAPAEAARPKVRQMPLVRPADPPRDVETAGRPRPGPYAAGFVFAVMLAATGVVLYAMTPALTDQGTLGEVLDQARTQADGVRLWLQDRADMLVR